jgi:hypothetical protein
MGALGPLDAFGALLALSLALSAALARLCAGVAIPFTTLAISGTDQRQRRDTGNQEKLASHYNLLAIKLGNVNRSN